MKSAYDPLPGQLEVEGAEEVVKEQEATLPTNPQTLHSFRCSHMIWIQIGLEKPSYSY